MGDQIRRQGQVHLNPERPNVGVQIRFIQSKFFKANCSDVFGEDRVIICTTNGKIALSINFSSPLNSNKINKCIFSSHHFHSRRKLINVTSNIFLIYFMKRPLCEIWTFLFNKFMEKWSIKVDNSIKWLFKAAFA